MGTRPLELWLLMMRMCELRAGSCVLTAIEDLLPILLMV